MTTLSAAILLFLIMDPLGNIPIFLSLLKDVAPKRRRAVMVRELLIALAVLLVFLMGGQWILKALQLREESISIAGGIQPHFESVSSRIVSRRRPSALVEGSCRKYCRRRP